LELIIYMGVGTSIPVIYMAQRFTAARRMETNEGRANATGLKPAPVLQGYFFQWKDCVENLGENLERTRVGEPPRVRQLFLETANVCNFRCPMCYTDAEFTNGGEKRKTVRTGFTEWKAAIAAAKLAGAENVAIAGCGEPFMDQNFWRLLEHVREQGMELLVFTNGMHVTRENAKRLKELCTTVVTKFFAMEPEAHDALVGVKGEYVKVRAALAHLLDTGLRAPNLGIDLVIAKQNVGELGNILRICRMIGVVPYFERLARAGRAARLNGNIVLPDAEVDAVFERLRAIDETEFGFTWGIVPGMPALANAETDKRMVAVHLDVFGDVQPGLATGHVIGNIRDAEGGMAGILADAKAWAAYYAKVAEEVGLEAMEPPARPRLLLLPPHRPPAYKDMLETAAARAQKLVAAHAEKCNHAREERAAPGAVRALVEGVGAALVGTEYAAAFEKIRKMAIADNLYARATGELLLLELVYGQRHLRHCDNADLRHLEWEAWGMDTHLAKDPVWKAFEALGGFAPINLDDNTPCPELRLALLKLFVEENLEFAAMDLVKWMVPEDCGHEECRKRQHEDARRFGAILGDYGGRAMPMLLNLAYEHAGGWKDIPKNALFFDEARGAAFRQLARMNPGLREAGEPLGWLRENAACVFTGANDLASLAGFLHHDARRMGNPEMEAMAIETIRLLGGNLALRQKMMRKKGVPKIL